MPIEACSYLRVSSTAQLSGDGFPRQREAISKFAAANGYELIAEFSDDISGKTELDNRPGLAACMERIENNGVKVVIVEGADRLARDAMVSEIIIREFQKVGGIVLTASGINLTEGGDLNPTAALVRGVLQLIAEFDRRIIVLKLRAARQRKKAKFNENAEGAKRYGYMSGGKNEADVPDPKEYPTLERILMLARLGDSGDKIAANLNQTGSDFHTRSGAPWRGSTIRKILARERTCNVVREKAS